jgi:hypothetical protein
MTPKQLSVTWEWIRQMTPKDKKYTMTFSNTLNHVRRIKMSGKVKYSLYRTFATIPAYWDCDRKHSHQWLKLSAMRNMHCDPTFVLGNSEMLFIYNREKMPCIGKWYIQFLFA